MLGPILSMFCFVLFRPALPSLSTTICLVDKLRHLPHTHLPTKPLEKAPEVKRIGDLIENYPKVAMKKQKHLVRCYGLDSRVVSALFRSIPNPLTGDRFQLINHVKKVRSLHLGSFLQLTPVLDFRLCYVCAAWDAERALWRAVIQLNIIRSIINIVETLLA